MNKVVIPLIEKIRQMKMRLAVAESCTGGLISSLITAQAGVSDIFWGGVISYDNSIKINLLDVDPQILSAKGAVSEEVALLMAKGIQKKMAVELAIAVTGIAGPSGGSKDKPVGTVFVAVLGPGFAKCSRKNFAGSRLEIQSQSAEFALSTLLNALS